MKKISEIINNLLSAFLKNLPYNDEYKNYLICALAGDDEEIRLNLIDNIYCLAVCDCVSNENIKDIEYILLDNSTENYHFLMKHDNKYYDAYNYNGVSKLKDLKFVLLYLNCYLEEELHDFIKLISKETFNYDELTNIIGLNHRLCNEDLCKNIGYFKKCSESIYEYYFKDLGNNFLEWLNGYYDNININESEYYYNKFLLMDACWDIPHYQIYIDAITESLNSIPITKNDLSKITKIKGIESCKVINRKNLVFDITYNKDLSVDDFIHLINIYGYTITSEPKENTYRLEACKPKLINEKFDFVYHVIDRIHANKILKYGLVPKRTWNYEDYYKETGKIFLEHPERTYCWKPSVKKYNIMQFAGFKKRLLNDYVKSETVILKIDLLNIDIKDKIRFYTDPAYNLDTAMFTFDYIPTKCITEISINDIKN